MERQVLISVLVVFFGVGFGFSSGAWGQVVWYVDDDGAGDPGPGDPYVSDPLEDGSMDHPFDAIQEALNSALSGDAIHVNQGSYIENLVWPQRHNITLLGIDGPEVTIIDGRGDTESCIYVGNGQTGVVIKGITVSKGYGSLVTFQGSIPFGGGICIDENVVAVVDHCIIENNGDTSDTYGGGVTSVN